MIVGADALRSQVVQKNLQKVEAAEWKVLEKGDLTTDILMQESLAKISKNEQMHTDILMQKEAAPVFGKGHNSYVGQTVWGFPRS